MKKVFRIRKSGTQFPGRKCFLRSCFESLAVGSPRTSHPFSGGNHIVYPTSHPLQPNLIFSEPNVSSDESAYGIGQVRFLGSAERHCASS